jgi:hypothetical protein
MPLDLYEYEAEMGDESGAAPSGEDTAAPETPAEPEAPWSPSQDEWQQTQQFIQAAAPILQQLTQQPDPYDEYQQQAYQQPQFEEEFDPFDPESVQRYIQQSVAQGLQQGLAQNLGPYEGLLGMVASQQGEALARQELDTIRGELGDFNEDAAFLVASGLIEQGGDPGQALRQSAQYAQEWETQIRSDEREKYKQELQNLQGAPSETPMGSASAANEVGVPTGKGRYEEAIRRALANRQPVYPTG